MDVYRVHPRINPNIKVDISHLAMDLGCRNTVKLLHQLKARAISLTLTSSEKKLCRPLALVHWILIGSLQKLIQISKLIFDTLLRVEVHKPAQALKSVKGPGNTFDLNPK